MRLVGLFIVSLWKTNRLHDKNHTMYLLTVWEGRTGKYLARGQDVRTAARSVPTSFPGPLSFSSLIVEERDPGCGWSRVC